MLDILYIGSDYDDFAEVSKCLGNVFRFCNFNTTCTRVISDSCKEDMIILNRNYEYYDKMKKLLSIYSELCELDPIICNIDSSESLNIYAQILTELHNNRARLDSALNVNSAYTALSNLSYIKHYQLMFCNLLAKSNDDLLNKSVRIYLFSLDRKIDELRDKLKEIVDDEFGDNWVLRSVLGQ